MIVWIIVQNVDFGDIVCEKRIFNVVFGFIYIFCFLNLKDGFLRRRLVVYYIVFMVENIVLVILWFVYKSEILLDWLSIVVFIVIYGGFVLGKNIRIFRINIKIRYIKRYIDLCYYYKILFNNFFLLKENYYRVFFYIIQVLL